MKKIAPLFILLGICAAAFTLRTSAQVQPPTSQRARVSPHETVNAIIDGTGDDAERLIIIYGRPYSKNPRGDDIRKIWGTLVPWGQVWRMGADEATLMITHVPLQFGDVTIPAGACSVYMLPQENGTSQLIFNKKVGQWGINSKGVAYPDSMKDTEIGRVDLKKDTITAPVNQFTIAITPKRGGGGGTLKLFWETTTYFVDFSVKK